MKIHITIEPGKFTGAVIEWIGNHRRTSAAFMLLLSFVALWAAPITKPHTFSNGSIVSASEMNANFDTLYTKVNALDTELTSLAVPTGAILFFNLSNCPAGFSELVAARGRYIVGLPSGGSLAATVGTALSDQENRPTGDHRHRNTAYSTQVASSSSDFGAIIYGPGTGNTSTGGGTAYTNGTAFRESGTITHPPSGTNAPYVQLLVCQKT